MISIFMSGFYHPYVRERAAQKLSEGSSNDLQCLYTGVCLQNTFPAQMSKHTSYKLIELDFQPSEWFEFILLIIYSRTSRACKRKTIQKDQICNTAHPYSKFPLCTALTFQLLFSCTHNLVHYLRSNSSNGQ